MRLLLIFQCTKCEILKKSRAPVWAFLTQALELAVIFFSSFFLSYIQFVSLKQIKAWPIPKEMKLGSKQKEKIGRFFWLCELVSYGKPKWAPTKSDLCLKKFRNYTWHWKKFILYEILDNSNLICWPKTVCSNFIISNKLIATLLQCSSLIKKILLHIHIYNLYIHTYMSLFSLLRH